MIAMFQADFWGAMNKLWLTGVYGMVAWLVTIPILIWLMTWIIEIPLKKLSNKISNNFTSI